MTEKSAAYLEMLAITELIDNNILMAQDLYDMEFDDLTPDIWEAVKNHMPLQIALLEQMKKSIQLSAKIISNDALYAHFTTVALAEDD